MKTYDVIKVSNQNTSFNVVDGEVKIGRDNNGSYVAINGKKIYGLSRAEYICQVKVVNKDEKNNQSPYRIVDNHYLHYVDGNGKLVVIDLDKLFNHGYTKGEENE